MGTAEYQGESWNRAPVDWATLMEPYHRPLWESMLDAAGVGLGSDVLDAGCGGGGASILAAKRGARISGIDAAEGMVEFAAQRVPAGDFRVGDIEFLPFEDNIFDAVIAPNSLQYAGDRVATLREFARVCKPSGRIVVGLFGPPEKVEFSKVFRAVRGVLPEPPPGAGPFELSMPGVLGSLFMDAGLDVQNQGEVDCPFTFADFETFWRAQTAAGPFHNSVRIVGEAKMKQTIRQALKEFLTEDGSYLMQPNMFQFVVGMA